LVAKEGDTKFTFHDAEKFATELTKHLELILKTQLQPMKTLSIGL
jgi:hypothetical protein